MSERGHLPGVLADVAEATSEAVAWRLSEALGGTEIHLTRKLDPESRLVRAVGMEAARKIVDALGYGPMLVPMAADMRRARRNARIAELREKGETVANLALGAGVHERTVYRVQRRARRRLPLFERED